MSAAPQRVVKLASRDVRVKVVVRVRPLLEHEGDETCVNILDDQSIEIDRDSQCLQYKYAASPRIADMQVRFLLWREHHPSGAVSQ